MNDGALINGVIRVYDLRSGEAEKGINGDEDDADGVIMNGASPLKIMVCGNGKGGSNISFPERRKWAIIGLVN